MSTENSSNENEDKASIQDAASGSYSISINCISDFRKELIKMIEQVKFNIGEYKDLSSSQIAEIFERKIN